MYESPIPVYYDDDELYVVSFDCFDALEVVDKTLCQGTVLSGEAAAAFKQRLSCVSSKSEMLDFLDTYRGLFQNVWYQ